MLWIRVLVCIVPSVRFSNPGNPNVSLLHLFSVCNVTSVTPSLASYFTLHPSPSHVSSLPAFSLFSIYYNKNYCMHLLSSVFLFLPSERKLQRAGKHRAWHSVNASWRNWGGGVFAQEPIAAMLWTTGPERPEAGKGVLRRERGPLSQGWVGSSGDREGQNNWLMFSIHLYLPILFLPEYPLSAF